MMLLKIVFVHPIVTVYTHVVHAAHWLIKHAVGRIRVATIGHALRSADIRAKLIVILIVRIASI